MAEPKVYLLPQAARVAGTTEDELRRAIQRGLLRAEYLQNVATYSIKHGDLHAYLKRHSEFEPLEIVDQKKVLIIDDEINFANIMKIELERDPRVEAKFVTWGRDGVRLAKEFLPDLCLIDFLLEDLTGDKVLEEMGKVPELRDSKVLVYSAHTREAIHHNPDLESRLKELGADRFISKSGGMRPLIIQVKELLGLEKAVPSGLNPAQTSL